MGKEMGEGKGRGKGEGEGEEVAYLTTFRCVVPPPQMN
jgi:hypothetical protein